MPMQLTPEQEQRIRAVVNSGAYTSAEDALDAALAAVETAAAPEFEGTREELEGLLMEGLASKELSEEEFWDSVDRDASAARRPQARAPWMKVTYRHASRDDLTRHFRYYLVNGISPEIAVRFKEAVRRTAKLISRRPASRHFTMYATRNFRISALGQ